ncbi:MAG: glycosyltransferase family 2 protein [Patescibacteria group bacterium]
MNISPNAKASTDRADICVVTVTYNNLHEECLSSLAEALRHTQKNVRVVVVDNASPTQKADEMVARLLPQATYIRREENHGMGRSTNFGAQQVDANYYFILNPDTRLTDPDILDKLIQYIESHPDVGIVAPRISNFDGSRQDTCRRFPTWYQPLVQRSALGSTNWGKNYTKYFLMHDFDQSTERPVDWVQGSAMFLPNNVWKDLGGFDDRFWLYFEDIDLCRRAWHSGMKVVYAPHLTLQHAYGRASAKIKNPVLNILKTRATRAHIASWAKYMWKWKFVEQPTAELA